jgi:hypothetical protein
MTSLSTVTKEIDRLSEYWRRRGFDVAVFWPAFGASVGWPVRSNLLGGRPQRWPTRWAVTPAPEARR